MFQVPEDQKETDLVGRSIVHKSGYKQATGNFQMCYKKMNCTLFLNAIHAVLFFFLCSRIFENIFTGFYMHAI